MNGVLFFICILFLLSSCNNLNIVSSTSHDTVSQHADNDSYESYPEKTSVYEVLITDNISSIARKHHVSPEIIISINGLQRPYRLTPGQIIKVPIVDKTETNLIDEVEQLDNSVGKEIYLVPKK